MRRKTLWHGPYRHPLMAGGIAVQAWLSITKPGGRTRWVSDASGRPVRLPMAAARVVASAVAAPVLDIAVGTIVGFPTPVLSLAAAVASRRRVLREIGRQPARGP